MLDTLAGKNGWYELNDGLCLFIKCDGDSVIAS